MLRLFYNKPAIVNQIAMICISSVSIEQICFAVGSNKIEDRHYIQLTIYRYVYSLYYTWSAILVAYISMVAGKLQHNRTALYLLSFSYCAAGMCLVCIAYNKVEFYIEKVDSVFALQ